MHFFLTLTENSQYEQKLLDILDAPYGAVVTLNYNKRNFKLSSINELNVEDRGVYGVIVDKKFIPIKEVIIRHLKIAENRLYITIELLNLVSFQDKEHETAWFSDKQLIQNHTLYQFNAADRNTKIQEIKNKIGLST